MNSVEKQTLVFCWKQKGTQCSEVCFIITLAVEEKKFITGFSWMQLIAALESKGWRRSTEQDLIWQYLNQFLVMQIFDGGFTFYSDRLWMSNCHSALSSSQTAYMKLKSGLKQDEVCNRGKCFYIHTPLTWCLRRCFTSLVWRSDANCVKQNFSCRLCSGRWLQTRL